ncbi:MAG: delta-lactam-biosynthetic de-N-acetylase [Christensenellales bacterium]|jgi:peptidoglycan-N-acetylmuramic acid deacetylase
MRIKKFVLYFTALLDVVLITLSFSFGYASEVFFVQAAHSERSVYSWYYMPRTDGVQPEPEESMRFIYNYNAYSAGDPKEKIIYLTFDAGYENGFTGKILDTLKKHGVTAAFFIVEHYIKTNSDLVNRMVNEGHLVCNHSTNHKDMANMTDFNSFKKEISQIEDTYYKVTGKRMPKYFRPPEGKFSELCLKYAQELGFSTIFWSFAYKDWYVDNQPDAQSAISTIISRTHPGEIALLHATSRTNSEILDQVLTEWENMGYTMRNLNYLVTTYDPK